MPMKMGIHCKPIDHSHSASLDSRVRRNDGGIFFPRKRLSPQPLCICVHLRSPLD